MKRVHIANIAFIITATLQAGEIAAVAHPGEKLEYEKTVVWTPLFQAAWDSLFDGLGPPVKIDPPNALMDKLDHFEWKADAVMPGDHWKVWAGFGTAELIKQANAEGGRIAGEKEAIFQIKPQPGSRMALGLLDRDLVFKKQLHRSVDAPLMFHAAGGTNSQVRFFGTRRKASAEYDGVVSVLAYQTGSHALQIASDADDAAVLYLPEKPEGFIDACAKLRTWRAKRMSGGHGSVQDPCLHENDDVRIPILKLENSTDFASMLSSDRYFGKPGDPWQLSRAQQRLKFSLTEKGAKLRATVEMVAEPLGTPPRPPKMIPRFFHYDRPFFVFLWREGAEWPYFGAWIGNSAPMEEYHET